LTLGLVVIGLLIGTPLAIAKWRRWEGRKALAAILARTGGELISYQELRCKRRGQDVTFRRDRNTGITSITVPLPAGYPIAIDVRGRSLGSAFGHDVVPSLELGDLQFDRAFKVEAAPTAVVEQLLDVRARSFLLEHRDCLILARARRLELFGIGVVPADVAAEAIDVAAGIVAGIRDAFATVAAKAESIALADGDSPYRPIAVEAGPDLESAHAAEIEKLARLQRRAMWISNAKWLAAIACAVTVLKLIALWRQR
jgi:hypothetical protein